MDLLERTAIISEITRRKEGQLGKTALMKLLHLLQDGLGAELGYRFTLYNYGPYDSEVMSDIEFAQSLGRIDVEYQGQDQGYRITVGKAAGDVPQDIQPMIEKLMNDFRALNARELELRSTLLFLSRGFSGDPLVQRLQELKPKYSQLEVRNAVSEMKTMKYLQ